MESGQDRNRQKDGENFTQYAVSSINLKIKQNIKRCERGGECNGIKTCSATIRRADNVYLRLLEPIGHTKDIQITCRVSPAFTKVFPLLYFHFSTSSGQSCSLLLMFLDWSTSALITRRWFMQYTDYDVIHDDIISFHPIPIWYFPFFMLFMKCYSFPSILWFIVHMTMNKVRLNIVGSEHSWLLNFSIASSYNFNLIAANWN